MLALLLAGAAPASAENKFAAPGAPNEASCLAGDPCSITTALMGAGALDDVTVEPGDYDIGTTSLSVNGATVHGRAGQPRPTIHGATTGMNPLVEVTGAGATLRHLALRQDGAGGVGGSVTVNAILPATLDDLAIVNTQAESTAARLGAGATLSSSTAHASGSPGTGVTAVGPGGPTLHNVTAWGTGPSGAGIAAAGLNPTVAATNTIARAPSTDLVTGANGAFSMTRSSWATADDASHVTDVGGQTAAPALANPTGGDFHQLPGSPTINAGIVNPASGLTDIDGDARPTGLLPDIGADEYVPHPPSVTTTDPVGITTSGGRLTGTLNPNGRATTYRFDYGTTPAYGSSTATQDAGAGVNDVAVNADLGDLAPGTILHYRLVATNADGETPGLDRVLIALSPTTPNITLPPVDTNAGGLAPQITTLTVPVSVPAGQPFTVKASGRDPDDPVNSIAIDFDDGPGYFAESACRQRPRDNAFRDNRASSFSVPYTFATPGAHVLEVKLGSGDCGRPGTTTTQTVTVNVTPAKTRAARNGARQAAVTAAADCKDADLMPTNTNLKRIEKATVCLLNQQRSAAGLKRFRTNRLLRKAAALHNSYMIKGKFFAHQGPGEPSLGQRFRKVKYRGGGGENLGCGAGAPYATPRGMVVGWMNSPVHKANILERSFYTVGVHARAQKPLDPQEPGATYTTEFGTTRK